MLLSSLHAPLHLVPLSRLALPGTLAVPGPALFLYPGFWLVLPRGGSPTARGVRVRTPGPAGVRGTSNPDRHEVSPPPSPLISPASSLRVPFILILDLLLLSSELGLAECPSQDASS